MAPASDLVVWSASAPDTLKSVRVGQADLIRFLAAHPSDYPSSMGFMLFFQLCDAAEAGGYWSADIGTGGLRLIDLTEVVDLLDTQGEEAIPGLPFGSATLLRNWHTYEEARLVDEQNQFAMIADLSEDRTMHVGGTELLFFAASHPHYTNDECVTTLALMRLHVERTKQGGRRYEVGSELMVDLLAFVRILNTDGHGAIQGFELWREHLVREWYEHRTRATGSFPEQSPS